MVMAEQHIKSYGLRNLHPGERAPPSFKYFDGKKGSYRQIGFCRFCPVFLLILVWLGIGSAMKMEAISLFSSGIKGFSLIIFRYAVR
jgi:hypothetical protein